jgi:hypothetical protein
VDGSIGKKRSRRDAVTACAVLVAATGLIWAAIRPAEGAAVPALDARTFETSPDFSRTDVGREETATPHARPSSTRAPSSPPKALPAADPTIVLGGRH